MTKDTFIISRNLFVYADATQTVLTKEWRNFLLNHDRFIFVNGSLRELKGRNLGAGVVEIYSKPAKPRR